MLRGTTPGVVGEREVPELVARALAPQREAPIVLISVDNSTREPLLDPHDAAAEQHRAAGLDAVAATVGQRELLRLG
jgi:hypothetical protein